MGTCWFFAQLGSRPRGTLLAGAARLAVEIRAACLFGGERDRTSVETREIIGRKVARRVATDSSSS
ncbi:MAG TPA: hypothetical protein VE907_05370, partial [Gammaproteobacteria bacterium]|nr:hypothetical protein [Gammaproteobacteria bacterium]